MKDFRDAMVRKPAADQDSGITVNNLTVTRYLELKQTEKDLRNLIKQIAACAKIDTTEIDRKEEKYRKRRREITGKTLIDMRDTIPTEQERAELEKLENAWLDEQESPKVTIDGNKITALILEYAACSMSESDRERYGYCDGLPDGARVKIE